MEEDEKQAELAQAERLGHQRANQEQAAATTKSLLEQGFSPHTKTTQTMSGSITEEWWVKPTAFDWPTVAFAISLLIFLLFMLKLP